MNEKLLPLDLFRPTHTHPESFAGVCCVFFARFTCDDVKDVKNHS